MRSYIIGFYVYKSSSSYNGFLEAVNKKIKWFIFKSMVKINYWKIIYTITVNQTDEYIDASICTTSLRYTISIDRGFIEVHK